jgi:hypothetical protein
MVARISRISSPKEPTNESEMILRLRVADTNRFASGDSLVKSPTRAGFAGFEARLGRLAGRDWVTGFAAALAARLGASGVTVEGAFGSPFAAVFLAGPGRFNLFL